MGGAANLTLLSEPPSLYFLFSQSFLLQLLALAKVDFGLVAFKEIALIFSVRIQFLL
jgi:hypothetical protein